LSLGRNRRKSFSTAVGRELLGDTGNTEYAQVVRETTD
jgi:hypothetical protein